MKYAEYLITAWLPIWKSKGGRKVELLRFSGPKTGSKIYLNSVKDGEIQVRDYYTLDFDKADPLDDRTLWESVRPDSFEQNTTVIVDSLSILILLKGVAETCKFLDKLSARVAQVVCIYQRDFGHAKIPSVKTLGNSYVRLEPIPRLTTDHNLGYRTLISHCKPGGAILQQTVIVEQNINSYEIKAEIVQAESNQKTYLAETENLNKIQASFRIEINDREMEQRKATPLPYTLQSSAMGESKIHYEPDETDDLDEEDPDDDLDF